MNAQQRIKNLWNLFLRITTTNANKGNPKTQGYDKQTNHENKFKTKKYGKYKEDKKLISILGNLAFDINR